MNALEMQIKMLRLNGIIRHPSNTERTVTWMIRFWNTFTTVSFMSAAVVFVFKAKDVLLIAESLAPTFTSCYNILKYAVFCINAEDLFTAMDDIRDLNGKCE